MEKENSEKYLERKLIEWVEALGGWCAKWVSPGCTGVPDRIIHLPGGWSVYCELKSRGKPLQPRQEWIRDQLISLGFEVWKIDTLNDLKLLIKRLHDGR